MRPSVSRPLIAQGQSRIMRSSHERQNRRMIAGAIHKARGYLRENKPLRALRVLRLLAKCAPTEPKVRLMVASLAISLGQRAVAQKTIRKLASLPACKPMIASGVARLQILTGDLAEARKTLTSAIERFPTSSLIWRDLAALESKSSDDTNAVDCLERAIELATTDFDRWRALHSLAEFFDERGRKDETIALYREIIRMEPTDGTAHYHLAQADPDVATIPERIELLRSLLLRPCARKDRQHIHFAVGHLYDQIRRPEQAFAHFHLGNDERAWQMPYVNLDQLKREVNDRLEIFDRTFINKLAQPQFDDGSLIFVVGMPRSGTTLVEQIIGSHSTVCALGERDDIWRLTRSLRWDVGSRRPYPHCARKLSPTHVRQLAQIIRQARRKEAGGRERSVSKLPEDFWDLGLIAILFPNAKIVHCRRHPIDTCLSCFMQDFQLLPWTTSLELLNEIYRLYERVMEHWRTVLPKNSLFEIRYEELVTHPTANVHHLCDVLNLPFEEGCLRFYENRQRIETASRWQVRSPIHDSSVGRWKRYREFLGPLLRLDQSPGTQDCSPVRVDEPDRENRELVAADLPGVHP
jgi:tetratricopeptide (TPR) repeat protein